MYADSSYAPGVDDEEEDPSAGATPPPSVFSQSESGSGHFGDTDVPPVFDYADKTGVGEEAARTGNVGTLYSPLMDPMQDALRARGLASSADLQRTYVDPAQRQRDEIENEAMASAEGKNNADAAFGDQMANRALSRAVASRLGLAQAADEAQLTGAHRDVMEQNTADVLARQAPKNDAAAQANAIKLTIAQMQQAGRLTAAQAQEYGKLADAFSHVAGSGYGGTEPGQDAMSLIQQAMAARGGAGGGGTPQTTYRAGQYTEGQTGTDKAGNKFVWHNAGAKGPNWYPA